MPNHFLRAGAFAVCLLSAGISAAQNGPRLETLSQVERTAVTGLIERLHSTEPATFAGDLSSAIDRLAGLGLDVKPTIAVLKASAGDRLQTVNDALSALCRDTPGDRKKTYCDVAQVDDPRTEDVQTAATAGGTGGGALGGALSSDSGATGGGGGNAGGGDSSNANTPPSISLRSGSGGSAGDLGSSSSSGTTTVVAVPGPQAATGLLSALLLGGAYGWRRLRHRSDDRRSA